MSDRGNSSGNSPTQSGAAGQPYPDGEDEVPVCLKCLTPHSPLQHYCENCGATVGRLTPYIPYVNIPYNYSIFGTMWKTVWANKGVPIFLRFIYLLLLIYWVPIMFVALPLILISKLRRKPPEGFCIKCRYNLTGNVSGVCPECGTEIKQV